MIQSKVDKIPLILSISPVHHKLRNGVQLRKLIFYINTQNLHRISPSWPAIQSVAFFCNCPKAYKQKPAPTLPCSLFRSVPNAFEAYVFIQKYPKNLFGFSSSISSTIPYESYLIPKDPLSPQNNETNSNLGF